MTVKFGGRVNHFVSWYYPCPTDTAAGILAAANCCAVPQFHVRLPGNGETTAGAIGSWQ